MNAYLIDAGTILHHYCIDHESMVCYEEPGRAIEIVVAATRGKAKALFLRVSDYDKFEWLDKMSIRLVASNLKLPEGVTDSARLWRLANKRGLIT